MFLYWWLIVLAPNGGLTWWSFWFSSVRETVWNTLASLLKNQPPRLVDLTNWRNPLIGYCPMFLKTNLATTIIPTHVFLPLMTRWIACPFAILCHSLPFYRDTTRLSGSLSIVLPFVGGRFIDEEKISQRWQSSMITKEVRWWKWCESRFIPGRRRHGRR